MTQCPPLADPATSPFHAGEVTLQEQLGVRRVEKIARKAVRPFMPDQHRQFFADQPFLVVSARDKQGRTWASILEGDTGFVSSPTDKALTIAAQPVPGDALNGALHDGADFGILGIELATRRRNRVNGKIAAVSPSGITFSVGQSFGNCPQHIRARRYTQVEKTNPGPVQSGSVLTTSQRDLIRNADTFFIATGYRGSGENAGYGMDASHRGGATGFVEILSKTKLQFPDYPGNNYYNTLGNIIQDPRAGMLFVDFASGSLLQLTGRATIDATADRLANHPGARRLVTLDIDEVVELPSALRLRWDASGDSIRELRLIEKRAESADAKSFVFEPRDRGALPAFKAGQHLPLEFKIPGVPGKVQRSYSLTNVPGDKTYQITVKREPRGLASRFLNDVLDIGSFVSGFQPSGDFGIPLPQTPLMLISAGIGITPMISLVKTALRDAPGRPVSFLHGARNSHQFPFRHALKVLDRTHPALTMYLRYSQPLAEDIVGIEFHDTGRLTEDALEHIPIQTGTHYFVCGPASFAAGWQAALERRQIPDAQIHIESFGAA